MYTDKLFEDPAAGSTSYQKTFASAPTSFTAAGTFFDLGTAPSYDGDKLCVNVLFDKELAASSTSAGVVFSLAIYSDDDSDMASKVLIAEDDFLVTYTDASSDKHIGEILAGDIKTLTVPGNHKRYIRVYVKASASLATTDFTLSVSLSLDRPSNIQTFPS